MKLEIGGSTVLLGTLVALIFIGGIFLGYGNIKGWRALNVMLGLVSIASFFGVLALPGGWSSERNGFSEGRVRFARTSALVMLFVVYYSTTIFWFGTEEAKLAEGGLSKELITLLGDLLKIVIPFYFGATAAAEIMKSRSGTVNSESKEGS